VQIITNLDSPPWEGERTVLSIGAYDGVHRGHQAVIQTVRRLASESGAKAAVMTFDRHPASVVRPESAPKLLTDVDQKLELLAATGLDATIIIHFDEAQSREEPAHFVRRVLIDCLNTSIVVVGQDFHFGRGREGNVDMLRRLGADGNFEVQPLELIPRPDGVDESISSTAIRRALAGGQVELAAALLGRPFEARGVVVAGDQRGRLLGFPTANVEVPNAVCLPCGWRVCRLLRAIERRRAPVRAQPRSAAHVLRARRSFVARSASTRLRGRSLRRTGGSAFHTFPSQ
jgi:riboflavin kinase/FMN adenylyltransferase